MHRYLLNISYIGTNFRGVQKQVCSKLLGRDADDPNTIQGQIEIGLKHLNPANVPEAIPSSRTDAGVHALHNAMHVDLSRWNGERYEPRSITIALNKYFTNHEIAIRVLSTYLVPDTFNSRRNAISRTYVYRLCVIKSEEKQIPHLIHLPIDEINRCTFLWFPEFDLQKAKEASQLFLGLHDFRTFMKRASKSPDKITRRVVYRLDVEEVGPASSGKFGPAYSKKDELPGYHFYNFTCSGTGFLYNQVRRTVAALVAVAQGKVTPRDINFMLQVPSHKSWDPRIRTLPAHGLYLCEVAYAESDIQTFKALLEQ